MPLARGKLSQKSDARARRAQTMDLDAPSAMHPQEARVAQQWPHPYTYRLSLTHSVLLQLRQGTLISCPATPVPLWSRLQCPCASWVRGRERRRASVVRAVAPQVSWRLRISPDSRHRQKTRATVLATA